MQRVHHPPAVRAEGSVLGSALRLEYDKNTLNGVKGAAKTLGNLSKQLNRYLGSLDQSLLLIR
jgi:hypothetical protein